MPYFGNEPAKSAIKVGDNTILSSSIADGVIINADIKSDAAIAMSKTALSAGTGITLATNTLNVDAAQTQITSVGTIGTGAWQGTKVASAYLDDDTAHLSGTQTFSGAKTFTANPIIQSDAGTLNFYNAAGTQRAFLQLSSTGLIIDTDSFLEFKPNNTTAMYIDSSGNVGIGTSSPTTHYEKVLHIHESSGSSAVHLTNNTTGTTADDGTDIIAYQDDFYIWNRESGGHAIIGTNGTERMRIASSGFVGIQTVDNSGDYTQHTISAPLHILQKTASQAYGLAVQGNSNANGGRIGIGEADSNFSTRANVLDIGFDSNTDFIYSRTGKDMIIGVNSAEVARFDTQGNFGIGASGSNLNARIVRGFSANKGLVIETAQPAIHMVDTDNTSRYFTLAYEQSAKTVYMHNQSNGPIRFDTNGTERMTLSGAGALQIGTGAIGATNADNWGLVSKSTTGGTIGANGGMGYFALGDNYTTADAILMVRNDGNRGSKGHSSGSSLVDFSFNDAGGFLIAKSGVTTMYDNFEHRVESGYGTTAFVTHQKNGEYSGDIEIVCSATGWKSFIYDLTVIGYGGGGHWHGMAYHNSGITHGYQSVSNNNGGVSAMSLSTSGQSMTFTVPISSVTHILVEFKLSSGGGDMLMPDDIVITID